MGRLRIVQITEDDKSELEGLGYEAVKSMHKFLECLDKVSDGQISDEMRHLYGERRGVPGTGRYGRRDGGYGERRGVPGTGRYGRRDGMYNYRDEDEREREEMYNRHEGMYGNRYDY